MAVVATVAPTILKTIQLRRLLHFT